MGGLAEQWESGENGREDWKYSKELERRRQ
jgi:hypothetical protein